MTPEVLPEFERPPVVETVLGVQFEPLPDFRNAHLGIFWSFLNSEDVRSTLGRAWPHSIDAPRLDPQHERFGGEKPWRRFGFELKVSQDPSVRIQIQDADRNRMIQLQNGRLHYNWLGHEGGGYPRYHEIRPEFDKILTQLKHFLADHTLGELRPNQWEVTYVNHIPRGTVWKEPRDWQGIFRQLPSVMDCPESVVLESCAGEWHFEIKPQLGRLHIQLGHGQSSVKSGEDLLRLTLTARGPIGGAEGNGLNLDQGLHLGRRIIVKTFKAVTSESAHEYWGLKS
ncbi:MAG: hypothetical protein IID41_04510 [Planctomycetes bacterium]|nr:hypothetical protein [Planctomycetota bacterium]